MGSRGRGGREGGGGVKGYGSRVGVVRSRGGRGLGWGW